MKEYIDTDVSIKQHSIQSIIDAWNQLEPYGIKMIYHFNPHFRKGSDCNIPQKHLSIFMKYL